MNINNGDEYSRLRVRYDITATPKESSSAIQSKSNTNDPKINTQTAKIPNESTLPQTLCVLVSVFRIL